MFIARDIGAARSPTDDFWYGPVSARGKIGAGVNSESALRLSTVYKCVRVRAETIGMLPLQVYRRLPGGGKEPADDHPLALLLHDAPNPWQTSMQWRSMMQAHLDLRGNAYSEIVYGRGGGVEMLVPLHPDRVKHEILPNGNPRYIYRDDKGTERALVFGQVLHIAGLSTDGMCGMNPIEAEREAIGAAIATRDFGAAFFANSARPPAWIKYAGKFSTAEAKRQWVSQFAEAYGGANSGKTPVLEQGMELHAIPISNVDAQYIDQRKWQDIDIAGIFRMPPHKIGILDRATWGNIEHQQIDFVTDTILPSCVAWEQALLRDLDFGDGYFAEFKVQMLLRGDTKTRYAAYGMGIKDGWLTRNEVRSFENLNALPGLDEPLEPLNMERTSTRSGSDSEDATDEPAQPTNGGRQALILAAAAERVARKEVALITKAARAQDPSAELAQAFAGHARFVADVMAVSDLTASIHVTNTLERATRWLSESNTTTDTDVHDVQVSALLRLEN